MFVDQKCPQVGKPNGIRVNSNPTTPTKPTPRKSIRGAITERLNKEDPNETFHKISEELISASIPMVKVESPNKDKKIIVCNMSEEQKAGNVTERSTAEEPSPLVLKNKLRNCKGMTTPVADPAVYSILGKPKNIYQQRSPILCSHNSPSASTQRLSSANNSQ